MADEPLYPANREQSTDSEAAEAPIETVAVDEIDQQMQDSIQQYGTDKPRRQRIKAVIVHD